MMDYPLSPALRVFFMDLQGNTVGVAGRRRVSRSRPALDMEQRRLSVGGMMQGEAPDMGNSPSRVLYLLYAIGGLFWNPAHSNAAKHRRP